MHTEYLYPEVGDRKSPNEWNEQGGLAIQQRAALKVREILASHYPSHVSAAVDAEIRSRFPVKLPRSAMEPQGAAEGPSAIQRVAG
jgi:trimethylamine--corrinoid protein Co-methyltransferase